MSRSLAAAFALCAAVTSVASDRGASGEGPRVTETLQIPNSSEICAESLRRQLMKDNYDYTSSEGEGGAQTRVAGEQGRQVAFGEATMISSADRDDGRDDHSVSHSIFGPKNKFKENNTMKNRFIENIYENKSETVEKNSKYKARGNHLRKSGKRRKEGREYMYDLNEDVAKRYRSRHRAEIVLEEDTAAEGSVAKATTVTYKVLKLRKQHRRSGLPAALIQEESPDGVSIVNLGPGPFPEFRLLGGRRQYMRAPRPLRARGEEELPPPAGDADARTEVDAPTPRALDRLDAPANSNDAILNSLKITVTPDEIFVL